MLAKQATNSTVFSVSIAIFCLPFQVEKYYGNNMKVQHITAKSNIICKRLILHNR